MLLRKKLSIFGSSVLIAALLISSSFMTFNKTDVNASEPINKTTDVIDGIKVYTSSKKDLYDIDGELSGTFYKTAHGGYVIYDTDNEIVEFSKNPNKYIKSSDKNQYYLGPLEYYEKHNDSFIDERTNTVANKDNLYSIQKNYKDIVKVYNSKDFYAPSRDTLLEDYKSYIDTSSSDTYNAVAQPPSVITEDDLEQQLTYTVSLKNKTLPLDTNHPTNGLGHCGSTAAAITFLYFYDKGETNFATKQWATHTDIKSCDGWELFTNHLITFIEPEEQGSTVKQLTKGMNDYLKSKNINAKFKYNTVDSWGQKLGYNTVFNTIETSIKNDKPTIIGIYCHPKYGNHWVVGEGINGYDIFGYTRYYYVVNDGWGNNDIEIAQSYVTTTVYRSK